jgi:hypothetical protein
LQNAALLFKPGRPCADIYHLNVELTGRTAGEFEFQPRVVPNLGSILYLSSPCSCLRDANSNTYIIVEKSRGGYGPCTQSLLDPPLTAKENSHPESYKNTITSIWPAQVLITIVIACFRLRRLENDYDCKVVRIICRFV